MAISFNNLGKMGRLGNQMFQYASLKGIAKKHGYSFSIPYSLGLNIWTDHQLTKFFNLDKTLIYSTTSNQIINESKFNFDKVLFETCQDNVDLSGYFQTEKYFIEIKQEIIKDFSFKHNFKKPLKNYNVLHIRRTDYINQSYFHPLCSLDYYKQAIEIIGNELPIVVVSDDIEWCKNNIKADFYSENSTNIEDLYIMSQAENNIIANSSFSWWGAWLNQNPKKIIVAPENWFGEGYSHYIMKDLIPNDWIKI